MKIAVTGATGFVGSHLVEHLCAAGHEVSALVRSPDRLAGLRHLPLRVVVGDLDRPDAVGRLVAGQDAVVHAAGLTRATRRRELLRVNVEGSVRLLEAALAGAPGLRRFVYLSSQAAIGPSPDGAALGEDAPQRPISGYGESKSIAERALAAFADRVPLTFVRPPWIYGPRDRDTLAYFRLAARGVRLVAGPGNRFSIVHVDDLARGVRLALESTLPGTRAYFFTDGSEWTIEQLALMIAEATGRRGVRLRVPAAAVAAVAAVNWLAGRVTRRPPLVDWRKVGEVRHRCWVVCDRRAREELGYRPAIATPRGMVETAVWYRAAGWL